MARNRRLSQVQPPDAVSPPPKWGEPSGEPIDQLVAIGFILRPHGIKGEVRVRIDTDFPERFSDTEEVHLFTRGAHHARKLKVEKARLHGRVVLLKLKGIDNIELADKLRNHVVSVPERELMPLEEDEYWHFQLEGLNVYNTQGNYLGRLKEVISAPAHDLYLISDKSREFLVPATKHHVLEINLDAGTMITSMPEMT